MMNADVIGDPSLGNGNDRSSNNRHDHDAGPIAGQGPEFRHAQRKDAGEHDGVEESDQNDAVHREVPGSEHRDRHEAAGAYRADGQKASSFHLLQERRTDEPSDHSPPPKEGNETGCHFFRQASNFGLAEVVDEEAADRNLGADIDENPDGSKDQVGMIPDAVVDLFTQLMLSMWDFWQLETANRNCQQDQRDA